MQSYLVSKAEIAFPMERKSCANPAAFYSFVQFMLDVD